MVKKFELIAFTEIGALDAQQLLQWRAILRREKNLARSQHKLDEDTRSFLDNVEGDMELNVSDDLTWSLRITPEGEVFVDYCHCPNCQGILNHITTAEAVEGLHRLGVIPPQALEGARHRAKILDEKIMLAVKTPHWLN